MLSDSIVCNFLYISIHLCLGPDFMVGYGGDIAQRLSVRLPGTRYWVWFCTKNQIKTKPNQSGINSFAPFFSSFSPLWRFGLLEAVVLHSLVSYVNSQSLCLSLPDAGHGHGCWCLAFCLFSWFPLAMFEQVLNLEIFDPILVGKIRHMSCAKENEDLSFLK